MNEKKKKNKKMISVGEKSAEDIKIKKIIKKSFQRRKRISIQ